MEKDDQYKTEFGRGHTFYLQSPGIKGHSPRRGVTGEWCQGPTSGGRSASRWGEQ
jgi:hypothetical protein